MAFLIWDSISDDSFSDFTDALIGLGRESFARVVADMDSLADDPLVRAIAAKEVDPWAFAWESIIGAASTTYGNSTGDEEDFWGALDALPNEPDEPDEPPADPGWVGGVVARADFDRMRTELPRLYALFAQRYRRPSADAASADTDESVAPYVDAEEQALREELDAWLTEVDGQCPRCGGSLTKPVVGLWTAGGGQREVRRCAGCQATLSRPPRGSHWRVAGADDAGVTQHAALLDMITSALTSTEPPEARGS